MKTCTVKIKGGLGNQMFQYAFIKALSLKHNCKALIDMTFYETDINNLNEKITRHSYQLDNFNISLNKITPDEIKKYHFNIPLINRIYEVWRCGGKYDKCLTKERIGNKMYIGYFQSEKYFKDYREEILKDFTLKTELTEDNKKMLERITGTNSVSLHIRRGDYVNLSNIYGVCTLEYYKKAIEYISSKVSEPHFYLFSDDIAWVKENFKINYPCTIVDINTEENGYYDLELMKNCKHNIIANSSFSWWGAWLNDNTNKIVISPQKWVATTKINAQDTICENWIRL